MRSKPLKRAPSHELPPLFISRLETLTPTHAGDILEAFHSVRYGSFRVNALRYGELHDLPPDIHEEFRERSILVTPFPWIPGVFTFDRTHEYAIKGTRAFYDGKIYLQGIASMLPVLALGPDLSDRVLDVCAAPGSKTTLMSALMQNHGEIVAIEQNQIRMEKLQYNARLQGATNITFVKSEAEKFLGATSEQFPTILLDAPCSAEGRIDLMNEKTYGFWSLENIERKADLQYTLMRASIERLLPGGVLVYSTCTLAPEENEGVVSQILNTFTDLTLEMVSFDPDPLAYIPHMRGIPRFAGVQYISGIEKTLRILPSEYTEGFFIAKMRKEK